MSDNKQRYDVVAEAERIAAIDEPIKRRNELLSIPKAYGRQVAAAVQMIFRHKHTIR